MEHRVIEIDYHDDERAEAGHQQDEGSQVSSLKRKTTSSIWSHFQRISDERAVCNYCGKELSAASTSGTSRLRRHVDSCKSKPRFSNVANMLIDHEGKFRAKKIDQKIWREKLARLIIGHELPFAFAEYELFKDCIQYANPEIKMICRNTAASDVYKIYEDEKQKLKLDLEKVKSRICLTSDLWTSITHEGYICVTGHYVDGDWKLNSKILSFCALPPPHTGMEIAKKIFGCLKDWGIEKKIFSLTLDNASANDSMKDILKHQLSLQNNLLCNGEFFHVRSCAHVLNIIVQDGLKVIGDSLHKIRESVKYVRGSESRMKAFDECIDQVGRDSGASLSMDVATCWNSTHTMLANALKHRYAFHSLALIDRNYTCCPTNEEWVRGEKIRDFLKPFDDITTLISDSKYPTSNLYFMKVWKIEMLLKECAGGEDELLRNMAQRMQVKFDKYWEEYSLILAIGAVLDPRLKLKALKYCYDQLDKNTSQAKMVRVKNKMYLLFEEYKSMTSSSKSLTSSHEVVPKEKRHKSSHFDDLYGCDDDECSDDGLRSGLDKYLGDPKINMQRHEDMDILDYWKVNASLYGIELALMASDILSIPIITVASESSFSAGSRVLNKYRSRLLPSNVQALLCARSWLFGYKEWESEFFHTDGDGYLATSLPSMVEASPSTLETIGSSLD